MSPRANHVLQHLRIIWRCGQILRGARVVFGVRLRSDPKGVNDVPKKWPAHQTQIRVAVAGMRVPADLRNRATPRVA